MIGNTSGESPVPSPGVSGRRRKTLRIISGVVGLGTLGVALGAASVSHWAWAALAFAACMLILLGTVLHANRDAPADRLITLLAAVLNRRTPPL